MKILSHNYSKIQHVCLYIEKTVFQLRKVVLDKKILLYDISWLNWSSDAQTFHVTFFF